MYDSLTGDVTFRLTVNSEGGETSESVRVLGWKRKAERPVEAALNAPPISMGELVVSSPPSPAPRPFAMPASVARSAGTSPVSEPPAIEAQARSAQGAAEPALGPLPLPAPPPAAPTPTVTRAPAPDAASSAQSLAGPLRVGSMRVLRRTAILYPPLARQARVSGTIALEVRVAADGHVIQAAAIDGPEMLRWIAAKGVKEWLLEPAVAGGKRVEAITRVNVTFVP